MMLSEFRQRVLDALTDTPRRYGEITKTVGSTDVHVATACRALAEAGLAAISEHTEGSRRVERVVRVWC